MTDEALTSRLLDAISEITRLGGEEERTSIVPGILVVDAAPNDLPSGYIKIVNPRDGTYVPCLTVSGLVVADNDLVNVLFAKGTEPIAISQASGSPSSGVKVSEVWESDFGAVAGSADATGNWTWQNDVTLASGNLNFSQASTIAVTGALQINATGGIVINEGGANADFRIEGDTEPNLFFVDAGNDRIGFGTTPAEKYHFFSSASFVTRFEANAASAFAGFQVQADDATKHLNAQMFGGTFAGTQFGVTRADTASLFSDGCLLTFGTKGAQDLVIGTTNAERMRVEAAGNIVVGTTSASGKFHVDQASTTAAIPVLYLDQADLSEEFIEFASTVGAGNPIDTAAVGTPYAKVRVSVAGVGFKFLQLYN